MATKAERAIGALKQARQKDDATLAAWAAWFARYNPARERLQRQFDQAAHIGIMKLLRKTGEPQAPYKARTKLVRNLDERFPGTDWLEVVVEMAGGPAVVATKIGYGVATIRRWLRLPIGKIKVCQLDALMKSAGLSRALGHGLYELHLDRDPEHRRAMKRAEKFRYSRAAA